MMTEVDIGNALQSALAYYHAGNLQKAVHICEAIIKEQPKDLEALKLFGVVVYELFLTASTLQVQSAILESQPLQPSYFPALSAIPRKGKELKESVIVIMLKHDIGECITITPFLPQLIEQNLLVVVYIFDQRLIPIFKRSFPGLVLSKGLDQKSLEVIVKDSRNPLLTMFNILGGNINFLSFYNMLYLLCLKFENFPRQQTPYIIADSHRVAIWEDRFKSLGNGLKVGISWIGGQSEKTGKQVRSTTLDQWAEIFSIPGVKWINLQYGDCTRELTEARDKFGVTIYDWEDSNPMKDLDDFTAKVRALDLVISVDNTTIHFSGALGIPTWMLLSDPCNWRWCCVFEDTPFYPSLHLFRQSSAGDWNSVFSRVATSLREYLSTREMPHVTHSYRTFLKDVEKRVGLLGNTQ
jgi:hypothetical protein